MNTPQISLIAILTAAAAFAQAPATAPAPDSSAAPRVEFEVASVRPSAPISSPADVARIGVHIDGQRVNLALLAMTDLIQSAYNVKLHQISGPDWMKGERYDINAKLPAGANEKQIQPMIRSLLEDRFGLKLHRETRDFPVYALTVAKTGLKMKESVPDPPAADGEKPKSFDVTAASSNNGTTINYGNGSYMSFDMNNSTFEAKKMPASALPDTLARFLDKPVVDMTGLTGNYDFTLKFAQDDFRAMMIRSAIAAGAVLPPEALKLLEASNGDSLPNALETLGLKLESRKAPIEVLVIDHIEKTPSDN
ncbi:MAG TPA: TIGR03435 family protein [Bryobacteraceae bacterium]|jgi:uncharacterized protein (TIGR03435 family)